MSITGKVILVVVIIVVIIAIVWYGVSRSSDESIKVGFIGDLTGEASNIGVTAKAAVELAVIEINNAGGIKGIPLEVIYEDSGCNAEDAVRAGNKLINIDEVPVIIGGLCSSATLGVAPIAESTETVLFSYCSSNPGITTAGDYIFRDYPSDDFQGVRAAEIAYNDLGLKKAAILYCLSDWCTGLQGVFKEKFEDLGGEIVIEEGFEQSTEDLRTQLTKIKSKAPEIIYFPSYAESGIIGLKQITELGIEASILGGDAWDDPSIPKEAGNSANGAMYLSPTLPDLSSFKKDLKNVTGMEEMTVCTPQAYDAIKIIAEIMNKVGVESKLIKDELYKVKGYKGISGVISLDSNGDLSTADYTIKVMQDGVSIER